MAERILDYVIEKEDFIRNTDCSFSSARCIHQYCPSSICINCTSIDNENCYYLSYIPHFHNTPIYQGNPDQLPLFLQRVLYYYSGYEYFNQSSQQFPSSSNPLLHMLEEKCTLFTDNCKELLRQSAMNDFVNILNVVLDFSGQIDGRQLIHYIPVIF